MRGERIGGWVTPVQLSDTDIAEIKTNIESRQTNFTAEQWDKLISFIEQQVEIHQSRFDDSCNEQSPSELRNTLNSANAHIKKALSILDSLDVSIHDLLNQYYFLANRHWLPKADDRNGHSEYEEILENLSNGLECFVNEILVSPGRGQDRTYSFFINQLIDFFERNEYPIPPSYSSNSVFYRVVQACLSIAFCEEIEDPERHIKTALLMRDEIQ